MTQNVWVWVCDWGVGSEILIQIEKAILKNIED